MNGLMRKFNYEKYNEQYNEQLKSMTDPITMSELPKVKLNLKGIREYARKKGVSIASITDKEKQLFIVK